MAIISEEKNENVVVSRKTPNMKITRKQNSKNKTSIPEDTSIIDTLLKKSNRTISRKITKNNDIENDIELVDLEGTNEVLETESISEVAETFDVSIEETQVIQNLEENLELETVEKIETSENKTSDIPPTNLDTEKTEKTTNTVIKPNYKIHKIKKSRRKLSLNLDKNIDELVAPTVKVKDISINQNASFFYEPSIFQKFNIDVTDATDDVQDSDIPNDSYELYTEIDHNLESNLDKPIEVVLSETIDTLPDQVENTSNVSDNIQDEFWFDSEVDSSLISVNETLDSETFEENFENEISTNDVENETTSELFENDLEKETTNEFFENDLENENNSDEYLENNDITTLEDDMSTKNDLLDDISEDDLINEIIEKVFDEDLINEIIEKNSDNEENVKEISDVNDSENETTLDKNSNIIYIENLIDNSLDSTDSSKTSILDESYQEETLKEAADSFVTSEKEVEKIIKSTPATFLDNSSTSFDTNIKNIYDFKNTKTSNFSSVSNIFKKFTFEEANLNIEPKETSTSVLADITMDSQNVLETLETTPNSINDLEATLSPTSLAIPTLDIDTKDNLSKTDLIDDVENEFYNIMTPNTLDANNTLKNDDYDDYIEEIYKNTIEKTVSNKNLDNNSNEIDEFDEIDEINEIDENYINENPINDDLYFTDLHEEENFENEIVFEDSENTIIDDGIEEETFEAENYDFESKKISNHYNNISTEDLFELDILKEDFLEDTLENDEIDEISSIEDTDIVEINENTTPENNNNLINNNKEIDHDGGINTQINTVPSLDNYNLEISSLSKLIENFTQTISTLSDRIAELENSQNKIIDTVTEKEICQDDVTGTETFEENEVEENEIYYVEDENDFEDNEEDLETEEYDFEQNETSETEIEELLVKTFSYNNSDIKEELKEELLSELETGSEIENTSKNSDNDMTSDFFKIIDSLTQTITQLENESNDENNDENVTSEDDILEEDTLESEEQEEINSDIYQEDDSVCDNKILLISEETDQVYLPYTLKEILRKLSINEEYQTAQEVIENEYILPLSTFKRPIISRFKETYKLMREKENAPISTSVNLALELMFNSSLHPAVIRAAKDLKELYTYLDCLYENELDLFDSFTVVYKNLPKIKSSK